MLSGLEVRLGGEDVVVEIGCGLLRITRVLAARPRRVVALDVSDEMLARARVPSPDLGNVEWVLGDGRSLTPLPDASVDACVSVVVLQHVPDPEITLDYVRDLGRAPRGQRHPAWLRSRADLDAIAATAGESGLTVERVWGRGTQYCQVLLRRAAGD